jgi:lipoate-protein ligase A
MARSDTLLTRAGDARRRAAAFHVDPDPQDGRFLMERDRARLLALEAHPERGPSLALYRWREPTLSLGYAQREERVLDGFAVAEARLPVVRRPTGGRAILHVREWTYSAVVPIEDESVGGGLARSVAALSEIVRQALAAVGVEAVPVRERGGRGAASGPADAACFARAVGHELTVDGRKLAGAAQRRLARALLQQGTILVGPGHERLADFLPGDERKRQTARERLREGTVTVEEIVGHVPDFAAFARALERAWTRALGPGSRGVFLDTPTRAS